VKRWLKVLFGFGLIALLVGVPLLVLQRDEPQVQARLAALEDEAPDGGAAGYLRVTGPAPTRTP